MSLRGCRTLLFSILTLFYVAGSSTPINLLKGGVQSYIDSLVEFDNNPRDRKFTGIVYPPLCFNKIGKSKFLLAKVLIYSLYEQLELKLECPVHRGVYLKPCR